MSKEPSIHIRKTVAQDRFSHPMTERMYNDLVKHVKKDIVNLSDIPHELENIILNLYYRYVYRIVVSEGESFGYSKFFKNLDYNKFLLDNIHVNTNKKEDILKDIAHDEMSIKWLPKFIEILRSYRPGSSDHENHVKLMIDIFYYRIYDAEKIPIYKKIILRKLNSKLNKLYPLAGKIDIK